MDFGLTEEQGALQKSASEFLTKEAKEIARETEEREEKYSPELWQKMADLGWMGVSFPEEYGGNEGDFIDLILLLEEMGSSWCQAHLFQPWFARGMRSLNMEARHRKGNSFLK